MKRFTYTPLALAATMALCAASVRASTTVVTTNDWFTAPITGADGELTASGWTADTSSVAAISDFANGTISLDTDGECLTYTPTASDAGTNAVVSVTLKFVAGETEPDMTGISNPQASIAVKRTGSNFQYIAYTNGAWCVLSGATPDTNTMVNVNIEMDYASVNAPRVRYLVGNTALKASGTEWLPLATDFATDPDHITNIGFCGTGSVSGLLGKTYYETIYPTCKVSVDGSDVTLTGLTTADMDELGLAGMSDAAASTALNAEAGNGNKVWQNYILGVADNEAVEVEATKGTAQVTLALDVTPKTDKGVTVMYRLEKSLDNGSTWSTAKAAQPSPSFDVTLSGGSGIYRIVAIFSSTPAN